MDKRLSGFVVAATLGACEQTGQSVLHPAGPPADRIADLWWLMLATASAVLVLVMVVLYRALTHRSYRSEPHMTGDDRGLSRWIIAGGIALPGAILTPLFFFSLHTSRALTLSRDRDILEVYLTGRQWWWDVYYPGTEGAARTANEIHVPVGRPVRIQLRSDDVIHSFWVPSLQGKMDLVPGKVNTVWIQADSVGTYRGECAEYCGLQHARMQFRVVAHPPAEFAIWLGRLRSPAVVPSDSAARAGQSTFFTAGCARCHTIRGTSARGTIGPDLTHLAGRLTLAAGTLPNTRGHLAGWIGNPQAIKPGNRMPQTPLRAEELQGLLEYLGRLR